MKALLVAVAAAWTLCFGPKTVICEAWNQVFSCNHFGCVTYGQGDPRDPVIAAPKPSPSPWYDKFDRNHFIMITDDEVTVVWYQWVPTPDGVLELSPSTNCVSNPCEIELPSSAPPGPSVIPMDDFSPVQSEGRP